MATGDATDTSARLIKIILCFLHHYCLVFVYTETCTLASCMHTHETYMQRCLQLAQLGAGYVAPNPMVGALLVHNDVIIGEGYHRQYGQAHAEVNCINSVAEEQKHLIAESTLYVSLEPCAHFGKTPPCADRIIAEKIPHVIIGCLDPFKKTEIRGIEKLRAAGVEVTHCVLEKESKELNKRFLVFHEQHRPYIILKWAQTMNGKIAAGSDARLIISNEFTNRVVHKWRSEEAAILVGTTTAAMDNPSLTNRLWSGANPVRLLVDMDLSLPKSLKVFDDTAPVIIFNTIQHNMEGFDFPAAEHIGNYHYQVAEDASLVHQVLNACYTHGIQSIIVEGGANLLQQFIDEDIWDEARIITGEELFVNGGLPAPALHNAVFRRKENIFNDRIDYFTHPKSSF